MKKETLEEREPYWDLVDAKAEQNNTIDLDAYAKGVQDGAKWMQERSYSEEDCYRTLHNLMTDIKLQGLKINDDIDLKKWFEQFKKKEE